MTTTTINDTLVHLESLYKAYNEVLDSAKQQLQELDITDDAIDRLADRLTLNVSFLEAVTKDLKNHQGDLLSAMSGDMQDALVRKLSQHVWDKLESSLEDALNDRFNELLNSNTVADKVRSYVLGQAEVKSALDIKSAMAMVIEQVM